MPKELIYFGFQVFPKTPWNFSIYIVTSHIQTNCHIPPKGQVRPGRLSLRCVLLGGKIPLNWHWCVDSVTVDTSICLCGQTGSWWVHVLFSWITEKWSRTPSETLKVNSTVGGPPFGCYYKGVVNNESLCVILHSRGSFCAISPQRWECQSDGVTTCHYCQWVLTHGLPLVPGQCSLPATR